MHSTPSSSTSRRPTVDEWGVYDPQQAGLAALYTRLTGIPDPMLPDTAGEATRTGVLHDGLPRLGPSMR